MSTITDKELLAICNLSNLKLEFANLKKRGGGWRKRTAHHLFPFRSGV